MKRIVPRKLQKGDTVRIIAPSLSLGIINKHVQEIANERLKKELGLRVIFGRHVNEQDDFRSSAITSRIEDFHEAFADPDVKAVLAVIGGWSGNQLLKYLDWDLIRNNPKIFCGFSDITVLQNAIYAKTGLVTYSGPSYNFFGQKLHTEYTMSYFQRCVMSDEPFEVEASQKWSDDAWWKDQDKRKLMPNQGMYTIQEGEAEGTLLGGNLCTLNLLQGTEYFPGLQNSVLFLEDDYEVLPHTFDRDLQSLLHLSKFKGVKGIVIGRFQNMSKMNRNLLTQIIKNKQELQGLPVIADVDFGHTDPKITFPIGGTVRIKAVDKPSIKILQH